MNGLLLLYCILGSLLCGAQNISGATVPPEDVTRDLNQDNSTSSASETTSAIDLSSTVSGKSEASHLMSTQLPTTVSQSKTPSPGPQPTTTTTTATTATPHGMFFRKECLPVFMVSGGLIIACAILLVSTLLLAWKVCHLNRRIKALGSNADLISNSEYWMGTAKKNKSKSETEVKETSMLMADVSQTQEEKANGTTKEEGGTVKEDGQVGEEKKKKEEGDTANSEEVSSIPVTVAESSSTSKPQEEATDSPSSETVAASSSEGTEEPKDVA